MLGDYTGNGSRKGSQGGLGLLEIWRKNTPGVKDRRGKKKYGSCYMKQMNRNARSLMSP